MKKEIGLIVGALIVGFVLGILTMSILVAEQDIRLIESQTKFVNTLGSNEVSVSYSTSPTLLLTPKLLHVWGPFGMVGKEISGSAFKVNLGGLPPSLPLDATFELWLWSIKTPFIVTVIDEVHFKY